MVKLSELKITYEDDWLAAWVRRYGTKVRMSPHFLYLTGNYQPLEEWMKFRNLPATYISKPLMKTLQSLIEEGQKEPIAIYNDMRINTGHKRSACLLFLGHTDIRAVYVPDNYKL